MRHTAPRAPSKPAARHVRGVAECPPPGGAPDGPPTLSLVLSRRARRTAAATRDPRLEVIERVLTGLQIAGNVVALVLSVVAWGWLATHRSRVAAAQSPDALTNSAADSTGLAGSTFLHPLATVSGTALVLIMLLVCLLMAPSVNPFYAQPPQRRVLHTGRSVAFAVLAVSTVALIAGAAR